MPDRCNNLDAKFDYTGSSSTRAPIATKEFRAAAAGVAAGTRCMRLNLSVLHRKQLRQPLTAAFLSSWEQDRLI